MACCLARRGSRFSISPHISCPLHQCVNQQRSVGFSCARVVREHIVPRRAHDWAEHGPEHGINSRASRDAGIARPRSSSGASCLCIPSAIPPRSLACSFPRQKGGRRRRPGSFGAKFLERIARRGCELVAIRRPELRVNTFRAGYQFSKVQDEAGELTPLLSQYFTSWWLRRRSRDEDDHAGQGAFDARVALRSAVRHRRRVVVDAWVIVRGGATVAARCATPKARPRSRWGDLRTVNEGVDRRDGERE